MTPSAATTLPSALYSGTDATTYVQYTATVPSGVTAVSIQLAGPADVTMTGSTVSFNKAVGFNYADFTSAAPLSDVASLGSAKIYAVNGVTIGAVTHVESIPVIAGKASIRVATSAAIPAAGSYVYKVHILGLVGATFSDYSANSNTLVISAVPTPSVNGAPISNVAAFQDNNSNGTVDTGDVLRLTFNEPMSAPDAAASITLTDTNATPTIGTVTNGVNSTWTLSSDKLLMTITLTGGPVIGTAGTTPGVQYGCSVTASSGVTSPPTTPVVSRWIGTSVHRRTRPSELEGMVQL